MRRDRDGQRDQRPSEKCTTTAIYAVERTFRDDDEQHGARDERAHVVEALNVSERRESEEQKTKDGLRGPRRLVLVHDEHGGERQQSDGERGARERVDRERKQKGMNEVHPPATLLEPDPSAVRALPHDLFVDAEGEVRQCVSI